MKIGIPKEIYPQETRAAATPETVEKMIKAGLEVLIEAGAGNLSFIEDKDYQKANAKIINNREALYNEANIILKVHPPIFDEKNNLHEIDLIKNQSILIGPLYPSRNQDLISKINEKKITAFSLDLLPRIARAQSMDILSSMTNIAGYKSVIMAANHLAKVFPMMTTAAGTIQPAKVIVIGAGVAGLQAIATARRLGAQVLAFDTRPVAEEQVKSLGADFVRLHAIHENEDKKDRAENKTQPTYNKESAENQSSEDKNGYAINQSQAFYQQEQEILKKYITSADVVITTALIPGKPAPVLITEEMVKAIKSGSVIVDLAAEQGGNCSLSEASKTIVKHAVTIIGTLNVPSSMPIHASQLYSRNILAFLNYVVPQLKSGNFDFSDEIIKNCLIAQNGINLFAKKAV